MSGWNEDNFLEKLAPLMEQLPNVEPCPAVEAFCYAPARDASNAINAHTARCRPCRVLQQRLQAFDAAMPMGEDAEWEQTEERLD